MTKSIGFLKSAVVGFGIASLVTFVPSAFATHDLFPHVHIDGTVVDVDVRGGVVIIQQAHDLDIEAVVNIGNANLRGVGVDAVGGANIVSIEVEGLCECPLTGVIVQQAYDLSVSATVNAGNLVGVGDGVMALNATAFGNFVGVLVHRP